MKVAWALMPYMSLEDSLHAIKEYQQQKRVLVDNAGKAIIAGARICHDRYGLVCVVCLDCICVGLCWFVLVCVGLCWFALFVVGVVYLKPVVNDLDVCLSQSLITGHWTTCTS